jgi:hypothetical protein
VSERIELLITLELSHGTREVIERLIDAFMAHEGYEHEDKDDDTED